MTDRPAIDPLHTWLLELTQLPTAAGHEQRVIAWIRDWASRRPALKLTEDRAGNLLIARADAPSRPLSPPIFFTAHLDHPAFTVERIIAPGTVQLGFRGGVMDDYFDQARVTVHAADRPIGATLTGKTDPVCAHFPAYLADLDRGSDAPRVGDVATWELPPAEIKDGVLHTNACDDLAAAAAALVAFDVLCNSPIVSPAPDVRLLFTRAEEIGFIGAIAACRDRTIPASARVIALENSRSFDDSPIGGGPIVRVGDRMSIFSPGLTAAIAKRAEELAGGPAQALASQKTADRPHSPWKWQRKLMAGGACEATVFCAFGYEATCLCLPLGNYHNMADLAAVQAGTNTTKPHVGREYISVDDFSGLVELLINCGRGLPETSSVRERIDKLWAERAFVVGEETRE